MSYLKIVFIFIGKLKHTPTKKYMSYIKTNLLKHIKENCVVRKFDVFALNSFSPILLHLPLKNVLIEEVVQLLVGYIYT